LVEDLSFTEKDLFSGFQAPAHCSEAALKHRLQIGDLEIDGSGVIRRKDL
jgi:hypothetical protein